MDFNDYQPDLLEDGECSLLPDLAVECTACQSLVLLQDLKDHKELHAALKVLSMNEMPVSLQLLHDRRRLLVRSAYARYWKNNAIVANELDHPAEWSAKITQLNEAFELVKSYLNHTFDMNRQIKQAKNRFEVRGEGRIVDNDSIVAIGACANQNKSHRLHMEDAHLILGRFGENKNLTYIGVFDGYDGSISSSRCAEQLHLALLAQLAKQSSLEEVRFIKENFKFDEINNLDRYDHSQMTAAPGEPRLLLGSSDLKTSKSSMRSRNSYSSRNDYRSLAGIENSPASGPLSERDRRLVSMYRDSFKHAYRQMDRLLARGRDETSKKRWSGATACTCVLERREDKSEETSGERNSPETAAATATQTWIHLANCGDVEAIMIFDNSNKAKNIITSRKNFKLLTKLHTLDNCLKERAYLEKNGMFYLSDRDFKIEITYIFSVLSI